MIHDMNPVSEDGASQGLSEFSQSTMPGGNDATVEHLDQEQLDKRTGSKDDAPVIHAVFAEMPQMQELYHDLTEHSAENVVVSDYDTHELLYVNGTALNAVGAVGHDYVGRKCYEFLLHRDAPCAYCKNQSREHFNTEERELYIPEVDRYYRARGRLTAWGERTAHVEYLVDITQAKQNRRHLDEMLQNIACGIMVSQADSSGTSYRIEYMNEGFCKLFERSEEELMACCQKDFAYGFHADDTGKVRAMVHELGQGSTHAEGTFRALMPDGRIKWLRIDVNLAVHEDGTTSAYTTYDDVTVQQQRTQELAASERSLRAQYQMEKQKPSLGEGNLLFHAIYNLDTGRTEEYEDDVDGWSLQEEYPTVVQAADNAAARIIGEQDRQRLRASCEPANVHEQYDRGIRGFSMDCRRQLLDGRILWVRYIMHPVVKPDTKELLLFEYCYDVHEQKMAEEMLNAIVAHDYACLACLDYRTGSIMRYDHGIPGDDADDRCESARIAYADEMVLPGGRDQFLEDSLPSVIMQEVEKDGIYTFETRIRHAGDHPGIMRFSFVPYDTENQIYLMFEIDVTDLLVAEEAKNEQMKEALDIARQANEAKSDFLSSMSHDMRTPMNAIVGMCDLARADETDAAQVHDSLATIQSSSQLLLSLINSILDMSRIESGKLSLDNKTFSMQEEIDKVEKSYRALAERKKQRFHMHSDITHDLCCGDVVRIHRALDNVLSNAIKYTPKGGSVTYTITEPPSTKPDFARYRFEIADNGVGMSEETQTHLFEPFYRAKDSSVARMEGTGLGLAITKAVVDLKGGAISVKSTIGKGTTFVIELPIPLPKAGEAAEQRPIETHASDSYDLSGISVLLCEDNPINQKVTRNILERAGAHLLCAADGREGLDAFMSHPAGAFDIILMDVRMPVMDGYEATRAIRACDHPQATSIPIVAMTGNAFSEDEEKSYGAGMDDHLTKPIVPAKLYETILHFVGTQ